METTTPQHIHRRLVDVIQAIVPSYQHVRLDADDVSPLLQAARWSYVDAGRDRSADGIAGRAVRTFTIVWAFGLPNKLFYGGGEAYGARLRIVTSYSGIPAQDLESLITSDGVDLRDRLLDQLDPTLPGLAEAEYEGVVDAEIDDANNVIAGHQFRVTWHQQTTW